MTLLMHSDWDYLRYVEQANGESYFLQPSRCASTVSKFMHVLTAANQQMVLSLNCDPAAPGEEPSTDTGCTIKE